MDLSDKKILLLSGGYSLDKVIENQLREKGAEVVVTDCLDVSGLDSVITDFIIKHKQFDGFVYSVVHSDFKPLNFVKPEVFSSVINDNVATFVEAVRSLNKHKGLKQGASIVAMSSISSARAMKAKMAFCAAKAALDATVRCLALELADKGIRVNSIQKGAVETDFEKEQIQAVSSINNGAIDSQQPLGLCKAEEVANLVAYLLSDNVKTMTGTSIVLDGGYLL